MYIFKKIFQMASPVVAIDFGGVLSIHSRQADTQGHRSVTINMPDCLQALEVLHVHNFKFVLNSFCGRSRAEETRDSLRACGQAKIFSDIVFVKDKLEKGLVTKKYGASVMIDDTLSVLTKIQTADPDCKTLIWFKAPDDHGHPPAGIITVTNWQDIVKYLTTTPIPYRAPDDRMNIRAFVYTLH